MKDVFMLYRHFQNFSIFLVLLNFSLGTQAQTTPDSQLEHRVFFIGDSTMATRNGYGDTVCDWLKGNAECLNLAKNGRSSKSFKEEGLWVQALDQMKNNPKQLKQWVLIQFGHNDQPGKPGRSTDLATEYPKNLSTYVMDARSQGATPILVTPLSRRSFKNGELQHDLADWAASMKEVANQLKVPLIDLNSMSRQKIMDVGEQRADLYAETPKGTPKFDRTHLGPLGACVFGALVLNQLPVATSGALAVTTNKDCEAAIK
jgi:lysophospholipase L1-like esterase